MTRFRVPLSRRVRDILKQRAARPLFELLQSMGVNVTPAHFYSEIPNIRVLRSNPERLRAYGFAAIQGANLGQQLETLREWFLDKPRSGDANDLYAEVVAEQNEGGGFGPIESRVLSAFVRSVNPRKIVQVGGGVSTGVIVRALRDSRLRTSGHLDARPQLLCVEPFPSDYLSNLERDGRIKLVAEPAQDWNWQRSVTELEPGDLLFIDSTHTTVPGSEVNRIILEWLPQLKAGVWVHFHDIYFPYDHSPGLLNRTLFFHRESVLLQAFLTCNQRFRIAASLSMLHHGRSDELGRLLGSHYGPRPMREGVECEAGGDFPSSTYLRVVS